MVTVLLALLPFAAPAQTLTGSGTVGDPYLIGSKADWDAFATMVSGGQTAICGKMTADISLGNATYDEMMGTETNPYSGTFDGGGHTLTVSFSATENSVAPFRWIAGATIKNLKTDGTLSMSDYKYGAGIVARVTKTTSTVACCSSSVSITSAKDGSNNHGGLVAMVEAPLTVSDCIFSGEIRVKKMVELAGLVNWCGRRTTISNCLNLGEFKTPDTSGTCATFARNADSVAISNCYYKLTMSSSSITKFGVAQGTLVTSSQLTGGEVAWRLQGNRSGMAWGQSLGTDRLPVITSEEAKRVCQVSFTEDGTNVGTKYVNSGQSLSLEDIVGSDYTNTDNFEYKIEFGGGFSTGTPITGDMNVPYTVTVVQSKPYEIATADNWKQFAKWVNGSGRLTGLDAVMTADIDLGSSVVMVGTRQRPYAGTFDGGGHTLTVNWSGSWGSDTIVAPFAYLGAATTKNLKTSGGIRNTSGAANISGLAGYYGGDLTLKANQCGISIIDEKVSSTVCGLYFAKTGDGDASVTVADCSVSGLLPGKTVYAFGLENTGAQRNQISNSLFSGEVRGTDLHIWGNATVSNSYFRHYDDYTLTDGSTVAGSEVTARQLKSGYVLGKLQGGRTDAAYWGQTLGTDDAPSLFDESMTTKSEAYNYIYYNVAEGCMYCKDFFYEQSGAHNMQSLPIGLDFKAASISSGRTIDGSDDEPQFYTSCLPYDFAMEYYMDGVKYDVTEFKAYTLQGISSDGKTVSFKEVSGTLEAARPYLLVVTAYTGLGTYNGGMVYGKEAESVTVGSVSLHGTYDRLENDALADSAAYILQDDNLWHPVVQGNSAWLAPFRAYLTIQSATGAKAVRLIDKNGMTTAISRISTTDSDGTAKYYDLNGRYIGTSLDGVPGGLYINNKGKKVRK